MYRYRESLPVDQRDAWAIEKRRMEKDLEEKPARLKRQAIYRRLSKKAEIAKSTFADLLDLPLGQIYLHQSNFQDDHIRVAYHDVRTQSEVPLCTVDSDNNVNINISSIESYLRRFLPETSVSSFGSSQLHVYIKGSRGEIGPLVGRLKRAGVECSGYEPRAHGHEAAFILSSLEDFVAFNHEVGGFEGLHELAS